MSYQKFSPERNHQKQMALQVWLPLGIILVALIGVGVLVVTAAAGSSPAVSQAADLSVIFLILPIIMMGVAYAVLIGFAIYGMTKIPGKILPALKAIQRFGDGLQTSVNRTANGIASPMIKVRAFQSSVTKIFRRHG